MSLSRINSFLDWSVKAGSLFGIPIRIHITLLFFLYPVLANGKQNAVFSLELAAGVVLSILLHELGHGLTAKRYGLRGLSIMLHGFGGFATSEGDRSPKQSLVITLAGPAVTFVLGFLLLGIGWFGLSNPDLGESAWRQFWIVHYLGSLNILLGVLNLIPCLPFDGGNALRAILNFRMPYHKALRATAHLGLIVAPIVAVLGFFLDYNLAAVFGLIGLITCYTTLTSTGGVKFGEFAADRRHIRELQAVKAREMERANAFLNDVRSREKEREEKERLRKILEASLEE